MGRMIADIIRSIKEIEDVFPASTQPVNQLVEMEVEEVHDETELELIQEARSEMIGYMREIWLLLHILGFTRGTR